MCWIKFTLGRLLPSDRIAERLILFSVLTLSGVYCPNPMQGPLLSTHYLVKKDCKHFATWERSLRLFFEKWVFKKSLFRNYYRACNFFHGHISYSHLAANVILQSSTPCFKKVHFTCTKLSCITLLYNTGSKSTVWTSHLNAMAQFFLK